MFPSPERRPRRGEGGFTLVELMVAFLIIGIVAAAASTLTMRGVRSTFNSAQLGRVTNVMSGQVEQMRGLPYYVSYATSTASVDVLDRYYPNLTAAPAVTCSANASTWLANKATWSGYVAAGTARCSFEPATGAFYRTVVDPALGLPGPASLVVDSQFVGLAAGAGAVPPAVTPPVGYSRASGATDRPPASQMRVTVTGIYGASGSAAPLRRTSTTDLLDRMAVPALVSLSSSSTALTVEGTDKDANPMRLELGRSDGEGNLAAVTSASSSALGVSVQDPSERRDGASMNARSPGVTSGTAHTTGETWKDIVMDAADVTGVAATTAGTPGYGTAVGAGRGAQFHIDQNRSDIGLSSSLPVARIVATNPASLLASGGCPAMTGLYSTFGGTFGQTTSTSPKSVLACARARAHTVQLFPTVKAPSGVLQIELDDVTANCAVTGALGTATTGGTLRVRWVTSLLGTYSAWTTITLTGNTVVGSLPTPSTVNLPALGGVALPGDRKLSDYISSWEAFGGVTSAVTGRDTSARVPSALSITTVPVREDHDVPVPESSVQLNVGRALCAATDRR